MGEISHITLAPTMSALFESRLSLIWETLKKKKIDSFLVTDMTNIRYLTGFSGSSGFLFLSEKEHVFATDFRYKDQSQQEVKGWDIIIETGNRIQTIKSLCRKTGTKNLGFESSISYLFYRQICRQGFQTTATDHLIERLRAIKTSAEIDLMKKAVSRAEEAFLDVKPFIREGTRERAVALRLGNRLWKKGCRNIPFEIIVASGSLSALPHATPTDKKLQKGDLIIIDWGGEADGYYSDMTRTFLIRGQNLSRQKELYQIVLEAHRKATSAVVPGISAKQIDSAARTYISNTGYGGLFGHGTGHGVGLQVHELPRISWNKSVTVRENMVFTIEPGIYLPGFGGVRIEYMVVVRKKKGEVLTSLRRELEIL
jgi:Xaa-Pro aminopeptidase